MGEYGLNEPRRDEGHEERRRRKGLPIKYN